MLFFCISCPWFILTAPSPARLRLLLHHFWVAFSFLAKRVSTNFRYFRWIKILTYDSCSHKSAWLLAVKTSFPGAVNLQISDFVCSLTIYVIANNRQNKGWSQLSFDLSLFNCIEMCFSFAPHVITDNY